MKYSFHDEALYFSPCCQQSLLTLLHTSLTALFVC